MRECSCRPPASGGDPATLFRSPPDCWGREGEGGGGREGGEGGGREGGRERKGEGRR